jgi:hypothetical protein
MINIFIIIILYLLIYQIYYIFTIEGLTDDNPPTVETSPPTDETKSSTVAGTSIPNNDNINLTKMNNSYSSLSLTDRNLLFLNDRVNILNNNYLDLSMNFIKLKNQISDSVGMNTAEATDLVGNTPIKVT